MTKKEIPTKSEKSSRIAKPKPITPEVQKQIDEWNEGIGQSMVDNLNANVLAENPLQHNAFINAGGGTGEMTKQDPPPPTGGSARKADAKPQKPKFALFDKNVTAQQIIDRLGYKTKR
jgi:hypothetical protein